MTDLINRMEGGQIINEWGQFFKKTGKEALEKIGKELSNDWCWRDEVK